MKRDYLSASSISKFTECPASWATHYDEDRTVNTRNDRTDVGNLVHGALELWRRGQLSGDYLLDPGYVYSFEFLEHCFDEAAKKYVFAEPLEAYKRGKELLASAFRMTQVHPTIPIQFMQVISVEQELVNFDGFAWRVPAWPLPARGAIDEVGVIQLPDAPQGEVTLFIEDHKTGRPKTHDQLVNEDIQPALYFYYARKVIVPQLEAQGLTVKRIAGAWNYIADGSAVPLYEQDFDHDVTEAYIANIGAQMVEFEKRYNEMLQFAAHDEEIINGFLAKYEKPNPYCSYCPRKGVCQTFSRLLSYNSRLDIVGPNVDWNALWTEYEAYQAVAKNAFDRCDEIKGVIPVYLDQEGLDSIELSDGREIVANSESRKKYRMDMVREILGDQFILTSATVTDTAIKKHISLLAITDPDRAKSLETLLGGAYMNVPGPRPVRARLIKKPKGKK